MTRLVETLAVLAAAAYATAGQLLELLTGLDGWGA